MLELASLGAQILHNRSVELAKKHNINLVVRSSLTNAEGTVVKEDSKVEKMFVSGIAVDRNVARLSLIGVADEPGKAFNIFSLLAKSKINVDIILQSIGRGGTKDITFTIPKSDLVEATRLLEENRDVVGYEKLSADGQIAKLSIVGAGMATNSGVASLMFEALYDANINIHMISTSEIKISVLIDEKNVDIAANYVHDKFMSENININI
jgi:aspartate kinase